MFVFTFGTLLFSYRGGLVRALIYAWKTDEAGFTDGMSFNHVTSWRKSALIQKPSAQTPKEFHQHGHDKMTMIFAPKPGPKSNSC